MNSQGSEVEPPRLVDAVEGEGEKGAVRHRVPELGNVVRDLKTNSFIISRWLPIKACECHTESEAKCTACGESMFRWLLFAVVKDILLKARDSSRTILL